VTGVQTCALPIYLILEILYLGASRWGMIEPREISAENPKKK